MIEPSPAHSKRGGAGDVCPQEVRHSTSAATRRLRQRVAFHRRVDASVCWHTRLVPVALRGPAHLLPSPVVDGSRESATVDTSTVTRGMGSGITDINSRRAAVAGAASGRPFVLAAINPLGVDLSTQAVPDVASYLLGRILSASAARDPLDAVDYDYATALPSQSDPIRPDYEALICTAATALDVYFTAATAALATGTVTKLSRPDDDSGTCRPSPCVFPSVQADSINDSNHLPLLPPLAPLFVGTHNRKAVKRWNKAEAERRDVWHSEVEGVDTDMLRSLHDRGCPPWLQRLLAEDLVPTAVAECQLARARAASAARVEQRRREHLRHSAHDAAPAVGWFDPRDGDAKAPDHACASAKDGDGLPSGEAASSDTASGETLRKRLSEYFTRPYQQRHTPHAYRVALRVARKAWAHVLHPWLYLLSSQHPLRAFIAAYAPPLFSSRAHLSGSLLAKSRPGCDQPSPIRHTSSRTASAQPMEPATHGEPATAPTISYRPNVLRHDGVPLLSSVCGGVMGGGASLAPPPLALMRAYHLVFSTKFQAASFRQVTDKGQRTTRDRAKSTGSNEKFAPPGDRSPVTVCGPSTRPAIAAETRPVEAGRPLSAAGQGGAVSNLLRGRARSSSRVTGPPIPFSAIARPQAATKVLPPPQLRAASAGGPSERHCRCGAAAGKDAWVLWDDVVVSSAVANSAAAEHDRANGSMRPGLGLSAADALTAPWGARGDANGDSFDTASSLLDRKSDLYLRGSLLRYIFETERTTLGAIITRAFYAAISEQKSSVSQTNGGAYQWPSQRNDIHRETVSATTPSSSLLLGRAALETFFHHSRVFDARDATQEANQRQHALWAGVIVETFGLVPMRPAPPAAASAAALSAEHDRSRQLPDTMQCGLLKTTRLPLAPSSASVVVNQKVAGPSTRSTKPGLSLPSFALALAFIAEHRFSPVLLVQQSSKGTSPSAHQDSTAVGRVEAAFAAVRSALWTLAADLLVPYVDRCLPWWSDPEVRAAAATPAVRALVYGEFRDVFRDLFALHASAGTPPDPLYTSRVLLLDADLRRDDGLRQVAQSGSIHRGGAIHAASGAAVVVGDTAAADLCSPELEAYESHGLMSRTFSPDFAPSGGTLRVAQSADELRVVRALAAQSERRRQYEASEALSMHGSAKDWVTLSTWTLIDSNVFIRLASAAVNPKVARGGVSPLDADALVPPAESGPGSDPSRATTPNHQSGGAGSSDPAVWRTALEQIAWACSLQHAAAHRGKVWARQRHRAVHLHSPSVFWELSAVCSVAADAGRAGAAPPSAAETVSHARDELAQLVAATNGPFPSVNNQPGAIQFVEEPDAPAAVRLSFDAFLEAWIRVAAIAVFGAGHVPNASVNCQLDLPMSQEFYDGIRQFFHERVVPLYQSTFRSPSGPAAVPVRESFACPPLGGDATQPPNAASTPPALVALRDALVTAAVDTAIKDAQVRTARPSLMSFSSLLAGPNIAVSAELPSATRIGAPSSARVGFSIHRTRLLPPPRRDDESESGFASAPSQWLRKGHQPRLRHAATAADRDFATREHVQALLQRAHSELEHGPAHSAVPCDSAVGDTAVAAQHAPPPPTPSSKSAVSDVVSDDNWDPLDDAAQVRGRRRSYLELDPSFDPHVVLAGLVVCFHRVLGVPAFPSSSGVAHFTCPPLLSLLNAVVDATTNDVGHATSQLSSSHAAPPLVLHGTAPMAAVDSASGTCVVGCVITAVCEVSASGVLDGARWLTCPPRGVGVVLAKARRDAGPAAAPPAAAIRAWCHAEAETLPAFSTPLAPLEFGAPLVRRARAIHQRILRLGKRAARLGNTDTACTSRRPPLVARSISGVADSSFAASGSQCHMEYPTPRELWCGFLAAVEAAMTAGLRDAALQRMHTSARVRCGRSDLRINAVDSDASMMTAGPNAHDASQRSQPHTLDAAERLVDLLTAYWAHGTRTVVYSDSAETLIIAGSDAVAGPPISLEADPTAQILSDAHSETVRRLRNESAAVVTALLQVPHVVALPRRALAGDTTSGRAGASAEALNQSHGPTVLGTASQWGAARMRLGGVPGGSFGEASASAVKPDKSAATASNATADVSGLPQRSAAAALQAVGEERCPSQFEQYICAVVETVLMAEGACYDELHENDMASDSDTSSAEAGSLQGSSDSASSGECRSTSSGEAALVSAKRTHRPTVGAAASGPPPLVLAPAAVVALAVELAFDVAAAAWCLKYDAIAPVACVEAGPSHGLAPSVSPRATQGLRLIGRNELSVEDSVVDVTGPIGDGSCNSANGDAVRGGGTLSVLSGTTGASDGHDNIRADGGNGGAAAAVLLWAQRAARLVTDGGAAAYFLPRVAAGPAGGGTDGPHADGRNNVSGGWALHVVRASVRRADITIGARDGDEFRALRSAAASFAVASSCPPTAAAVGGASMSSTPISSPVASSPVRKRLAAAAAAAAGASGRTPSDTNCSSTDSLSMSTDAVSGLWTAMTAAVTTTSNVLDGLPMFFSLAESRFLQQLRLHPLLPTQLVHALEHLIYSGGAGGTSGNGGVTPIMQAVLAADVQSHTATHLPATAALDGFTAHPLERLHVAMFVSLAKSASPAGGRVSSVPNRSTGAVWTLMCLDFATTAHSPTPHGPGGAPPAMISAREKREGQVDVSDPPPFAHRTAHAVVVGCLIEPSHAAAAGGTSADRTSGRAFGRFATLAWQLSEGAACDAAACAMTIYSRVDLPTVSGISAEVAAGSRAGLAALDELRCFAGDVSSAACWVHEDLSATESYARHLGGDGAAAAVPHLLRPERPDGPEARDLPPADIRLTAAAVRTEPAALLVLLSLFAACRLDTSTRRLRALLAQHGVVAVLSG